MSKQLENRLQELRAEFEAGQQKMAELESQVANLRNTMLRNKRYLSKIIQ